VYGTTFGRAPTTPASADGSSSTTDVGNAGETPEADANTAVTVALVRPQTEQLPGLITVSVPQDMIASGRGFSFPLPSPLQESAATNKVQVTLTNGRRLPAWLRYMQSTRTFVATGAPAGALPTTVLMRIGKQRWTVQIATGS
jgi:hypothetical protein